MATDRQPQQERRGDAYAIPKSAARVVASLVAVALISSSGAIFRFNAEFAAYKQQVDFLWNFGPQRGERNTKADGDKRDARINEMIEEIHQSQLRLEGLIERYRQFARETERRLIHLENRIDGRP